MRAPLPSWSRLAPLLAGGSALLGLLAASQPARACVSSSSHVGRVLGVAPDGTFATYDESNSEAMDGPIKEFTLRDVHGYTLAKISLDAGQEPAEQRWDIRGDCSLEPLFKRAKPLTVPEVEAALVRRYRLTPLRPSALTARVPRVPKGCGPILLSTPDGEVPVHDVGVLSPYDPEACTDVAAQPLEHPSSPLVFLRVRYEMPFDESHAGRLDRVQWLPATRVTGLRAAERGKKALARRDFTPALASFDEALRLVPEYMPARVWAVQALAASGASEPSAQRILGASPDEVPCLGGNPDELRQWFSTSAPATWSPLDDWPGVSPLLERCDPSQASLTPWGPADDLFDTEHETSCGAAGDSEAQIDSDAEPSAEPEPPAEPAPRPILEAPPPPALEAPPAPWRVDPRSASLGALAVAAFVAGHRRGQRGRGR